jgi:hypothetical protein
MAQVVPIAQIVRKFTCSGLAMEQPDSIVACYRAGHECRSTWERLEDEHGVFTRSFCGCCGDEYGSMSLPWPMVSDGDDELDRLRKVELSHFVCEQYIPQVEEMQAAAEARAERAEAQVGLIKEQLDITVEAATSTFTDLLAVRQQIDQVRALAAHHAERGRKRGVVGGSVPVDDLLEALEPKPRCSCGGDHIWPHSAAAGQTKERSDGQE